MPDRRTRPARRLEEAIAALEKRAAEEEEAVRDRMRAIAADAEAERGVLEARLHELSRRIEEALVRAAGADRGDRRPPPLTSFSDRMRMVVA